MLEALAMSADIFLPHEAAGQAGVYTCWPAAADLWESDLEPARAEFARFLTLAAEPADDGTAWPVTVLAASAEAEASARAAVGAFASVERLAYGDVWARDTGPVFIRRDGALVAVRFKFNGWGGKYRLDGDDSVGAGIAALAGARIETVDLIAEGGALEFDGEGSVLTTRQCLLNANRNPGLSEAQVEDRLKAALGVSKVLWLDEGLIGDHTDGHVDNIARFAAPGLVVCQAPSGPDDPQADVLDAIARQLAGMTDARGRRLRVLRIPSPGRVLDEEGEVCAASHMNWVIGPKHVVMPAYDDARAAAAAEALAGVFPGRRPVISPSHAILTGGGAFHCVTCHVPAERTHS